MYFNPRDPKPRTLKGLGFKEFRAQRSPLRVQERRDALWSRMFASQDFFLSTLKGFEGFSSNQDISLKPKTLEEHNALNPKPSQQPNP